MSVGGNDWTRRDFAGGLALLAMVIGVPAAVLKMTDLQAEDAPSDRQRLMIADVADLVIPRTDTPGAKDVQVGDFVILALAHGLSGTRAPAASGVVTAALEPFRRRDGSIRHLRWLEQTLDHAAAGDFLRKTIDDRARLLATLDTGAMAQDAPFSPWVAIKALILTGYYTSQAGGSRELRYELVPGKWEWDIPKQPGDRAFSSDWTAVEFG